MPVALVDVDGGTSSTSTITSAGVTPSGSNRLMLACATGLSAADDLKSGGSGGTSLTKLSGDQAIFFSTWFGNVWQLLPGPTGSTTGYVDFGSGNTSAFSILYLSGVDQTTPRTTAQTFGPTTDASPSCAFTGLSAGQPVVCAVMYGSLPQAVTGFTPNGSTTVARADYGPVNGAGERASTTIWLTGTADGSGNVTLGGSFTATPDVSEWYAYGFGLNAAAGGGTSHPSTGALAAQDAVVAGTAARTRAHPSTGALAAQEAVVSGAATHLNQHPSTGALEAQSATIAGTAARTRQHPSEGALAAQAAVVDGTATRFRAHPATGALEAQDAVVAGDATVTPAAGPHPSIGDLQALPAEVVGIASVIHSGQPEQNSGGYFSGWPMPPRKKKRSELLKEEALEILTEKEIEAKQAALKAKQELRRAEAKDRQVVEQLRQIYAEQDALLQTVKTAKARIAALRKDDDEIAMILALAG